MGWVCLFVELVGCILVWMLLVCVLLFLVCAGWGCIRFVATGFGWMYDGCMLLMCFIVCWILWWIEFGCFACTSVLVLRLPFAYILWV